MSRKAKLTTEQYKLIEENYKLVYSFVHKHGKFYNLPNCDFDDLVSIASLGLIKAAQTFKQDKNIKFSTYAYHIMDIEFKIEFRALKSNKRNKDRELLYLNATNTGDKTQDNISFIDNIEDKGNIYYDYVDLIQSLKHELNERQKIVLDLTIKGYKQKEIKQVLDLSQPQISRIWNEIKQKARSIYYE